MKEIKAIKDIFRKSKDKIDEIKKKESIKKIKIKIKNEKYGKFY